MLVPAEGQGTGDQPTAGPWARPRRLEARRRARRVLFPSSPGSTSPTRVLVMAVVDGPRRAAEIEPMIRQLGWQAWEEPAGFTADLLPVDEAIRRGLAGDGGRSSSRSRPTAWGRARPAQRARTRAAPRPGRPAAMSRDRRPRRGGGVAIAAGVGVDATTVGGTLDPRYNRPVPITGRVRSLRRPLRLDGRADASWSSRWARGGHRGGAHRRAGDRAGAFTSTRPSIALSASSRGTRDRGGEVLAPVPRRSRFARACWVVDTPGPSTAR